MVPKVVKFIKKVEWWLPGPGEEEKNGGCCLMGIEFQLCEMKRVLEIGCTNENVFNTTEWYA